MFFFLLVCFVCLFSETGFLCVVPSVLKLSLYSVDKLASNSMILLLCQKVCLPVAVAHATNPSAGKAEAGEFEANLVYRARSGITKAIQRNPVSKSHHQQK